VSMLLCVVNIIAVSVSKLDGTVERKLLSET